MTDLVARDSSSGFDPRRTPERLPWFEALGHASQLAEVVARTPFVKSSLRGNVPSIVACVMFGLELGLEPMTSLALVDVIDGRPAPSAELARALFARVGEMWTEHESPARVTVAGRRHGSDVIERVTWTMDDAKRAGLASKANWRTYPKEMLYARASATLVRRLAPDVLAGVTVTAEELDDGGDEPAHERAPVRRAKRPGRSELPPAPVEVEEAPATTPVEAPVDETPQPSPPESFEAHTPNEDPLPPGFDEVDETPPRTIRRPTPQSGNPPPSEASRRRMLAMLHAIGVDSRPDRIAFVSSAIGREVDSSNALDAREVADVCSAVELVTEDPRYLVHDTEGRPRFRPELGP